MTTRCTYCGKKIAPPKRRFCCDAHKDKYHNETNPRGKFAHLAEDGYEEHPFSSEALG